jgi:hypothetical protein
LEAKRKNELNRETQ